MTNQYTKANMSVKAAMRQMIREELISLLNEGESKSTSQYGPTSPTSPSTGEIFRRTRKRRPAFIGKVSKGRVTRPDDKRLKANRGA